MWKSKRAPLAPMSRTTQYARRAAPRRAAPRRGDAAAAGPLSTFLCLILSRYQTSGLTDARPCPCGRFGLGAPPMLSRRSQWQIHGRQVGQVGQRAPVCACDALLHLVLQISYKAPHCWSTALTQLSQVI